MCNGMSMASAAGPHEGYDYSKNSEVEQGRLANSEPLAEL